LKIAKADAREQIDRSVFAKQIAPADFKERPRRNLEVLRRTLGFLIGQQ
jgi:hypothetical protein